MAVVGSAEIVVRAITTQVKKDIQKAFKNARPAVEKEGEKAGKAYADGFNRGLGSAIPDGLRASINEATSDIAANMRQAIPDAARQAGSDAATQIDQTLGRAGSRAGNSAGSGFFRTFTSDIRGAVARLATLSSAFDILGPAIANVVAGLSSLVSGLFAVVSAAGQAAGAIAVLPGLLGVLFQSLGAGALAFNGIGEAVKAGTEAQEAAAAPIAATTKAQEAQRKASDEAAKANERLRRSRDEVTNAERLYEMTQRDLARAQDEATEGTKSQAAAEYFLAEAKKNRDAVVSDPNSTGRQGAGVQREYDQQLAAMRQNEAQRKASADRVLKAEEKNDAARERLSRALRARQAAQDKADKAKKKASNVEPVPIVTPAQKAADAYAAALAKLTPEARLFVAEILKMKDRFSEVSDVVASQMLPPLTEALQILQSTEAGFFDVLKEELAETGSILGGIGLQATKAFTTDTNMNLFQRYLAGNNDILDTLSTRVDGAQSPIEALVSIFLKLGNAIQPVTERFAEFIGQSLVNFDNNNSLASLTDFFTRAGDKAAQLGRIIGNIIGIIGALGGAASDSGNRMLDSFEKATAKFEKFLKTPDQQQELRKFFSGVEKNFRSISAFLGRITAGFLSLGDNPGIRGMIEGFEDGEKAIGEMFEKLTSEEIGRDIGELGSSFAELINAFTQSGQMEAFIDTLTAIIDTVVNVIGVIGKANEVVTNFTGVNFGAGALALIAVYRAFKLVASVTGFGRTFDKLTASLFKLVKAPFKKIASGLSSVVRGNRGGPAAATPPAAGGAAGGAATAADAATDGNRIGSSLSAGIAQGIAQGEPAVVAALDKLLGRINFEFEQSLGNATGVSLYAVEIGEDIVKGLAQGINVTGPVAVAAIRDLGNDVIKALKARLGIASPSRVMADMGEDTGEGFVIGVRSEADNAFAAGRQLGQSAAAGARAGAASAAAAGTTVARGATPAAAAAAAPAAVRAAPAAAGAAGAAAGANASRAAAGTSRLGRIAGPVTKSLGGLTKGLGALSAGLLGVSLPVAAVIAALVVVFFALKRLYSKSPEFKKFVDTLVGKLKEFGDFVVRIFDEYVVPALGEFFGWVNKNLPKVGKFFGDLFDKIRDVVINVLVPAFKEYVLPVLEEVIGFVIRNMPTFQMVFNKVFNAIKFYITNILIPAYKLVWEGIKKAIDIAIPIIKFLADAFSVTFKVIKFIITEIFVPIIKQIIDIVKDLSPAFRVVFDFISTTVSNVFGAIKLVWNNVLRPVFDGIKSSVENTFSVVGTIFDGFKKAFRRVGDVVDEIGGAVSTAFGAIKDAASTPIKFVVDTLWNNGLVKMAGWIPGLDTEGWKVDTAGWAQGGYTGPGGKYDVAGLVHRDEFVIQKSSRRVLEAMYPGLLEHINKTGKLPKGHASGGLVRGAAYSGAVRGSARGMRGFADGGFGIVGDIAGAIGGGFKWAGDKVVDGVKWTAEKAKAMLEAIDRVVEFFKEFPEKISSGLSGTEWGRLMTGFPKAAANKLVESINGVIPNGLGFGDNPINSPFSGVEFRAMGGRVRAGSPYVVGELRPELFVPDRNGTIIPDISKAARSGGTVVNNNGPALQIDIDRVEAHDYQDFMAQMQRRARAKSMGGFSLPTRGKP